VFQFSTVDVLCKVTDIICNQANDIFKQFLSENVNLIVFYKSVETNWAETEIESHKVRVWESIITVTRFHYN
jgi:hypothetical protein